MPEQLEPKLARNNLPTVGALIVTWNRRAEVLECIESVLESDYPRLEVYMVDNASTDGSYASVSERYPAVRLMRSERNTGFTGGNNLGLARMLEDGIEAAFLLNDDAVVAPDTVSRLAAGGLNDPTVGVLSPKVVMYREPERIWSAGGLVEPKTGVAIQRFYDEPDDGRADEPAEVEYGVGCAMLVRMRAISDVGLMDPRYYMYYEEVDWCRRMREAGHRVLYVPESRVRHKVHLNGASRKGMAYYFSRNRLLYLEEDAGANGSVSAAAAGLVRSGLTHMLKGRTHEGRLVIRGVLDYYARNFGRLGSNGD